MSLCKADPPGWRYQKDGTREWYAGGQNYNQPHVPAAGAYDSQPTLSCVFCGIDLSQ